MILLVLLPLWCFATHDTPSPTYWSGGYSHSPTWFPGSYAPTYFVPTTNPPTFSSVPSPSLPPHPSKSPTPAPTPNFKDAIPDVDLCANYYIENNITRVPKFKKVSVREELGSSSAFDDKPDITLGSGLEILEYESKRDKLSVEADFIIGFVTFEDSIDGEEAWTLEVIADDNKISCKYYFEVLEEEDPDKVFFVLSNFGWPEDHDEAANQVTLKGVQYVLTLTGLTVDPCFNQAEEVQQYEEIISSDFLGVSARKNVEYPLFARFTRTCPKCPAHGGLLDLILGNSKYLLKKGECLCPPSATLRGSNVSFTGLVISDQLAYCEQFDSGEVYFSAVAALYMSVLGIIGLYQISLHAGPLVHLVYAGMFFGGVGGALAHGSQHMFGFVVFERFTMVLITCVIVAMLVDEMQTTVFSCDEKCPGVMIFTPLCFSFVFIVVAASAASLDPWLSMAYAIIFGSGLLILICACCQAASYGKRIRGQCANQKAVLRPVPTNKKQIGFLVTWAIIWCIPTLIFAIFDHQCLFPGAHGLFHLFLAHMIHWLVASLYYIRQDKHFKLLVTYRPLCCNHLWFKLCHPLEARERKEVPNDLLGFWAFVTCSDKDFDPEDWYRKDSGYTPADSGDEDIEMQEKPKEESQSPRKKRHSARSPQKSPRAKSPRAKSPRAKSPRAKSQEPPQEAASDAPPLPPAAEGGGEPLKLSLKSLRYLNERSEGVLARRFN